MAAAKLRQIRRRIRTVQSTRKITRAMELIAASRIVRAQQRLEAARPYAEQITAVVANLAALSAGGHPLLETRSGIRRVGFVVVTADRGLAGAYNANVIRAAESGLQREREVGRDHALVLVGRKGQSYFRFRRYRIDKAYVGMSDLPSYEDAREVADEVVRMYEAGDVDLVHVAYTRFLSAATQRPVVLQLLPVEPPPAPAEEAAEVQAAYEFEPELDAILEQLLPRYVEARLFTAMLDASASEHASRQRAMKAATDNADELIRTLTRIANRARQEEITSEIMDIVGGVEALRQAELIAASSRS